MGLGHPFLFCDKKRARLDALAKINDQTLKGKSGIMHIFRLTILMFLTAVLSGCTPALPDTPYPASDTYRVPTAIRFNLARRNFFLHVPPGIAPDEPLPLVVVLHGAFSTALQTEAETGFSALADRENFFVAYPEGIGLFGLLHHWNAGHCCGKAAADNIDDVGYLAEVIAVVSGRVAVDQRRIYLVGMSNGGMMTYRYAIERGYELAAIAVVSATIGSSRGEEPPASTIPPPIQPLPVIAFHGTSDEHIPPAGGPSPLKGGARSYRPVAEAMEYWRTANGCEQPPQIRDEASGAMTGFIWDTCRDGQRVEYYRLKDWGHRWPAPYFTAGLADDDGLKNFDATERIWRFLRDFRR